MLCAIATPAMAQYYHFGRNKIQYEDFDWHVLRTEHFDVYFYPEMQDLAEHGAYFAEEVYEEMRHRFEFELKERVPLIFYASNLHFKQTNTTPGFIPDGVGGFFEFLKGRVVIPANGDIHQFRRVIRHELVHVFTFNKVVRVMRDYRRPVDRFLPLWFTEGIAEYWSGEPSPDHEMVIRDALFSNYLVPLESIYRITGSFLMYKQGEAICRFIAETYGEESLLALIDGIWIDRDFRKVMEVVLQEDFGDIASHWEEWMKAQYYPDLPDTEFPSFVADGIAGRGFSAKPVHYRAASGRESVLFVGNRDGYSSVYEVPVDSTLTPTGKARVVIRGERNDRFEAFHLFESRLSISKDGHLAFVTKSGGRDVVHIYDLEDRELEQTIRFDNLTAVYSPDWSPDSRRIVFTSIDGSGFSDLYIYDFDSRKLSQLTKDTYDDRDPSWSPDGTQIAFASDRTTRGEVGSYNLFVYALDDGMISYVTAGNQKDASPRWSPGGDRIAYVSTSRGEDGKYTAKNIWVADVASRKPDVPALASLSESERVGLLMPRTKAHRLTGFAGAAYDPTWTDDDRLLFSSFEGFRFAVRSLPNVDSLSRNAKETQSIDLTTSDEPWEFGRLGEDSGAKKLPYRKRYRLDIAQGQISQSAAVGTFGGAVVAFSDMLSDDYLYLTVYNTGQSQRSFFRDLSFSVTRVQLRKRTNIAYGLFRFSGRRYDITDPDASTSLPVFFETMYGGFGGISHPLSKFRRLEVNSSLAWSDKEVLGNSRQALLLSNSVSLIHDNALYSGNGPVAGRRAGLTVAYTTDVRFSNVSYFTGQFDFRTYHRLLPSVTFASRFTGRWNQGKEARLFVAGGSWDVRGFRIFSIRGQKMWLTSHELRFPIVNAPALITPILAPFGITSLRGAFFFDAAHAWNDDYNQVIREIYAGETIGAAGFGLRLNLFRSFVLRYDLGYRYSDGFKRQDKFFRQFFFGWDF